MNSHALPHIIMKVLAGVVLASFVINFLHLGVLYTRRGEKFLYQPASGVLRVIYILWRVASVTLMILWLIPHPLSDDLCMIVVWGWLIFENTYSIYRRHLQRRNSQCDAKVT